MPNAEELLRQLINDKVVKVKLAITDIDGVLRGKVVSLEKFKGIANNGFGFCDVVFGWDAGDNAYDNVAFTGWHTGYPDAPANVDINTFRRIPWEQQLPFFLADFSTEGHPVADICPRTMLKKVISNAELAGFSPIMSQEFEWFNFIKTPNSALNEGLPHPLSDGMFGYSLLRAAQNAAYFNQLFDDLLAFGVPLEGLHTETGPGVFEAAITYAPALEAADRAVLFKNSVKEIAHKHGIMASFMAKWNEQLPGCSGHVHQSLWDPQGRNVFYDAKANNHISGIMENYIAGQLHCLPFLLPMYAPTINSYKRLVEGAWAPTTLTWGIDNRTTALRALPGSPTATRLETRVVGSDSNPYLAMAACLASGLYGIQQGLQLNDFKATIGNGYTNKIAGVLPKNLEDATIAMQKSSLAGQLFGQAFVDHFCSTRIWECRQFEKAVTNWEHQRYFEII